ncbi:MAG: hypothetical protein A2580_08655, partial [Hydrogenophilales bacterium RIFOXYD1_FULL_62_11]
MLKELKLVGALSLALAIGGCSTMQDIKNDAVHTNQLAGNNAQGLLDNRPSRGIGAARGPIVTDVPFVDITPVPVNARYPITFSRVVEFNAPSGMGIGDLSSRLQTIIAMPVIYEDEIGSARAGSGVDGSAGAGSWQNLPQLPGGMPNLPSLPISGIGAPSVATGAPVDYSGSVRGLLDTIASSTNSAWEFDESRQRVRFYRYKTENFRIASVQGSTTSSASLGGASSSSTSSPGGEPLDTAEAQAKHTTEASLWTGVESAIKQLISKEGVYSVNQVAGTIVVRDLPANMETIRQYIEETNAAMSRQVDVEVNIYRVLVNNRDTRGLNWNVLFQQMIANSPYGIALDTLNARPEVIGEGLTSAIIKVKDTDANGIPHRYGGSALFIDALSSLGETTVVTNTSVLTANNHPAPVKVVKRTAYLAETAPNFATGGIGGAVAA